MYDLVQSILSSVPRATSRTAFNAPARVSERRPRLERDLIFSLFSSSVSRRRRHRGRLRFYPRAAAVRFRFRDGSSAHYRRSRRWLHYHIITRRGRTLLHGACSYARRASQGDSLIAIRVTFFS